MTFFLFLFLVSSFVWILSYVFLLWPALLNPFLWLFGSSLPPTTAASYIVMVAFGLQLVLLIVLYLVHQGRSKLQAKLRQEFSKNIALSERARNITTQLLKQENDLKASQSEAQKLALYKERAENYEQLLDEVKNRNQELMSENATMSKELVRLRAGKPAGVLASIQSWIGKILP